MSPMSQASMRVRKGQGGSARIAVKYMTSEDSQSAAALKPLKEKKVPRREGDLHCRKESSRLTKENLQLLEEDVSGLKFVSC